MNLLGQKYDNEIENKKMQVLTEEGLQKKVEE